MPPKQSKTKKITSAKAPNQHASDDNHLINPKRDVSVPKRSKSVNSDSDRSEISTAKPNKSDMHPKEAIDMLPSKKDESKSKTSSSKDTSAARSQ
jgi:hypothetical protein